ncbi:unnamed protein product [marine sediment metagenome]|uniref:Uncharacterized protein n=1 Tax=marine sediment metagenome TaxID=412755 RepID=X1W1U7_9ZZZZ
MGDSAFLVLATVACAVIGAVGVAVGLAAGVRSVQRDEGRWDGALQRLERVESESKLLRLDWDGTIEELSQLAGSVEKGRRRAAASLSAADRKERDQAGEPQVAQTPQEIRNHIRRGMTRIGGR